jgi:redox-sensitive bicupin YhaK (pirin superfamily)
MALRSRYQLSAEHVERSIYVVKGEVAAGGQTGTFGSGELIVFRPGAEIILSSEWGARLMLIGGEPLPERRHIY